MKENVYELRTTKSGYDNEEEEDNEERRGEERRFVRGREGSEWGRVVVSLLFCRLSLSISRISHQFRGPSLFTAYSRIFSLRPSIDFPTTNYPQLYFYHFHSPCALRPLHLLNLENPRGLFIPYTRHL